MKVLFIRTDPGNIDPRIQKESSSLFRLGYEVHVFGWDRRSQFPKNETINGVHFHRVRIPAPYGSKSLAFILPLFWLSATLEILRIRPDVVHACDLDAFIPALLSRPIGKHRLIYDIFDHFAEKLTGVPASLRRMIGRLDHRLMALADIVIVTDEHRRSLIWNKDLRRVEIIMNVPPNRESLPRQERNQTFTLCYAGSIIEHRGLRLIADAVRTLPDVKTVFAGMVPRLEDELFLRSEQSIEYLGMLPYGQSLDLMASSDAILALYDPAVPINALASSNKIFEAMWAGRPVITNKETTMAGIVAQKETGCLVPYGDAAALRDVIIKLKNDAISWDRLGRNGRQAFLSQYNWNLMELKLKDIYESLTNRVNQHGLEATE